jgi:hypothetical protein
MGLRTLHEGMIFSSKLGTTFSGFVLIAACSLRTWGFFGESRQSKRRKTVSGRMTLRFSLRLYGPPKEVADTSDEVGELRMSYSILDSRAVFQSSCRVLWLPAVQHVLVPLSTNVLALTVQCPQKVRHRTGEAIKTSHDDAIYLATPAVVHGLVQSWPLILRAGHTSIDVLSDLPVLVALAEATLEPPFRFAHLALCAAEIRLRDGLTCAQCGFWKNYHLMSER